MAKWIDVSDRLPDIGVRVIATNGLMTGEAYLYGHQLEWYRPYSKPWIDTMGSPVTHWQPMPSEKEG